MKNSVLLLLGLFFIATSCSKIEDLTNSDSSDKLKGETNIPINTVGNTFSSIGMKVNGTWVDFNPTMEITKSVDGVNTIKIVADLSQDSKLAAFNNIIPSSLKDAQGRVSFETKVKITSEGWLDYSNVDQAPVVAVRYDSNVGDKYSVTTKSGTKIERVVTKKSTDDDFDYGFYQIKVIKVEQETTFPGIKKYVAYFNHKFGLVGIEIVAEDGSILSTQISANNY